jgi:hypothetical protein
VPNLPYPTSADRERSTFWGATAPHPSATRARTFRTYGSTEYRGERPDAGGDDRLELVHLLVAPEDAQHHVDAVEGAHDQDHSPVEQPLGVAAVDGDGLVEDRPAKRGSGAGTGRFTRRP